jgi:hypothetical protein
MKNAKISAITKSSPKKENWIERRFIILLNNTVSQWVGKAPVDENPILALYIEQMYLVEPSHSPKSIGRDTEGKKCPKNTRRSRSRGRPPRSSKIKSLRRIWSPNAQTRLSLGSPATGSDKPPTNCACAGSPSIACDGRIRRMQAPSGTTTSCWYWGYFFINLL